MPRLRVQVVFSQFRFMAPRGGRPDTPPPPPPVVPPPHNLPIHGPSHAEPNPSGGTSQVSQRVSKRVAVPNALADPRVYPKSHSWCFSNRYQINQAYFGTRKWMLMIPSSKTGQVIAVTARQMKTRTYNKQKITTLMETTRRAALVDTVRRAEWLLHPRELLQMLDEGNASHE